MKGIRWRCPYCDAWQIPSTETSHQISERLLVGKTKRGSVALHISAIACSDPTCLELSLNIALLPWENSQAGRATDRWRLLPRGGDARRFHESVPVPIHADYLEACLIADLSPKASATLARRCLQGMIRDFFGIAGPTLDREIKELRRQAEARETADPVAIDVLDAIDAVRQVGNIGAHMERDINVIVDVDPGEARALLDLIELLFEEWYITRHARRERIARVQAIADVKKEQKKLPPPTGLSPMAESSDGS